VCDEFGGFPDEALRALRRAPDLIHRVIELRDYRRAFQAVRQAKDDKDLPPEGSDVMVDLAFELYATGGKGLPQ
jgi:hypothetical protein